MQYFLPFNWISTRSLSALLKKMPYITVAVFLIVKFKFYFYLIFKLWDVGIWNINLSLPCFTKISWTCSELSKTIFSKISFLFEANFKIFSITISLGLSKSSIKFPTDKTEVICKERGSWSSFENIGLSFLLLSFDDIFGIETGV